MMLARLAGRAGLVYSDESDSENTCPCQGHENFLLHVIDLTNIAYIHIRQISNKSSGLKDSSKSDFSHIKPLTSRERGP